MHASTASRVFIHAPDGPAALALEQRLAHLNPAASAHGTQWVVWVEAVHDLPELEASIRAWLREVGCPEAYVRVDGRELRITASRFEGRGKRGSNGDIIG